MKSVYSVRRKQATDETRVPVSYTFLRPRPPIRALLKRKGTNVYYTQRIMIFLVIPIPRYDHWKKNEKNQVEDRRSGQVIPLRMVSFSFPIVNKKIDKNVACMTQTSKKVSHLPVDTLFTMYIRTLKVRKKDSRFSLDIVVACNRRIPYCLVRTLYTYTRWSSTNVRV